MIKNHAQEIYERATQIALTENGNKALVAKLLIEASNLGCGGASAAIANWYHYGIHFPIDPVKEVFFCKLAAKQGDPDAYFSLGSKYEEGFHGLIKKNQKIAFRHYVQSALLGYSNAMMEVARCYKFGIGVKKDAQLASMWRRAGKDKGGAFVDRSYSDD